MSIDGTSSTNSTLHELRKLSQPSGSESDVTTVTSSVVQAGVGGSTFPALSVAMGKREDVSAVDSRLISRGNRHSLPGDMNSTHQHPGLVAVSVCLVIHHV